MIEEVLYRVAKALACIAVIGIAALLIARYILVPLIPYAVLFGILVYAVRYMFKGPRK